MTSLIVTCRDENGVDEDKTHCIDIGNNRLTNYMHGNKISFDDSTLKIGHCKIGIVR